MKVTSPGTRAARGRRADTTRVGARRTLAGACRWRPFSLAASGLLARRARGRHYRGNARALGAARGRGRARLAAGWLGLHGYPPQPIFGAVARDKDAAVTAPESQACPRVVAPTAFAAPACR
jgi:hypothetical protein